MEQVRKKHSSRQKNKARRSIPNDSLNERALPNRDKQTEESETLDMFNKNTTSFEDNSVKEHRLEDVVEKSQNEVVPKDSVKNNRLEDVVEKSQNELVPDTVDSDNIQKEKKSFDQGERNKIKSVTSNAIRPYTETQLSAFYTNSELGMIESFSQQFIEAELRGLAIRAHPLYEMLSNYLSIRAKLTENNVEINQLKKEYADIKTKLWSTSYESVSGKGNCPHGETMTASHSYRKSTLSRSACQSMQRTLSDIHKCILENHTLYSFLAENLKLQIEIYLQNIIAHCMSVTQLNKNKEITLNLQKEPEQWKPYLTDLRICISVLFAFQRKLVKDNQFIDETRAWLTRLIAVLLRVANYQDHLFILNHVLRCPQGVGDWASCFIQTPMLLKTESPFVSYEINHILAVLAIILSPIRDRDKFLGEVAQPKDEAQEALWVVIDSDGEEDEETSGTSLRENDLVSLINQLPLGPLFSAVSLSNQRHHLDHDLEDLTEQHILRFLAFSTSLLRIINKGLSTYNQPRYTQFAKRLSRLILHIVQYVTDLWERFCSKQTIDDAAMMQRLQVEYDAFFLRAVYHLYTSQKLGAWQFLAVVPYNSVSLAALWKIFYFLHSSDVEARELLSPSNTRDFRVDIDNREFKEQFVDKLNTLSDGEVYYLLNTFANVALARTEEELIVTATMDLLQIGFVNEATQDICSKTSRILLTHITSKYPSLLSKILKQVMENIGQIGDLALYLYEELPLSVWKVEDEDVEVLTRLLKTRSESQIENKLARMIISRLNWDFGADGNLFLPYRTHRDVALLVLEAVDEEPAFTNWGWQTILRLKLHISDNGFRNIATVADIEIYDVLLKGVREKKPLHAFVSLLMTSWGHLIPLICTNGFGQLLLLESQQKYEAVLFALYLMMPLFLNAQECIVNCLEFQEILSNLLYVDQSYISMAKSLLVSQRTVLQQFGNMIETQMKNYCSYNLESPRILVRLWMNSLVSVEQWTKNYGVLYLLDVIIKASFFHKDAISAATDVLKELLQDTTPQEQGGAISSIFKWVSSSNQASLISTSLSPFPWLAYVMIGIEHEERERKTGLWKELLKQLHCQKGKVNVDSAIKKAAGALKIGSISSGSLCIYRYAQQAMDTAVDHPILVLLWQKFFELYFDEIPSATVDRRSIGDKFFEGVINFAFLKKLKGRLQETRQHYQNKIYEIKQEEETKRLPYFQSCLKVFTAFELWLEEPRLHIANILLPSFPPQYEQNLLLCLVQADKTPWYPYVDYDRVQEEQQESIRIWRISNFREQTNVNKPLLITGGSSQSKDPIERTLKRLESYDVPKPAPSIVIAEPLTPPVDISSVDGMLATLRDHFKILKNFAKDNFNSVSGYKSLNGYYQELIPKLYKDVHVETKKAVRCRCDEKKQNVKGPGTAIIKLQYEESRLNEGIDSLVQTNRQEYEFIFDLCSLPPKARLHKAAAAIEHTIKILQQQIHCNPATSELGVELFYHILKLIDKQTLEYLPTKTLYVNCLEKLGKSHICGVEFEISRLLDRILKEPNLGEYLAPHFAPGNIGTSNLLSMYQKISDEIGQKYDVSFALLSKFDIDKWLHNKKPKLNQRSKFIESVLERLSTLGPEPPVEALNLHGLYRKHLLSVFQFQFPEHYGEILVGLLRSPTVAISVWTDLLNSLSYPTQIRPRNPLRDQLRVYAQNQQKLNYQEILETSELLSGHFTKERLQFGLYGLYPKCEHYMDVYCLLLGMTGHALIVTTLNVHRGLESDKMCEKIWPYVRDMYAPWIAPYSMQNVKDSMAAWIQQLTDDRSVLLPWIPSNVHQAQKMLDSFKECMLFLLHVFPACSVILNYVWQWYVTTYAHCSVKEHVFNSIHQTLLVLPWHNFWPSIYDLEAMLKIVDQYLPECHQFLGQIFMSVKWTGWINLQFANSPDQVKSRVYHCYVSLLVKLSNEPNIRSQHVEKFNNLLVESENLDCSVLDTDVLQYVMDWYIMSCDSSVIFKSDPLDLDVRVLQFLKTISGFENVIHTVENSKISSKRYIYVRGFVKLLSIYVSKNKMAVPSREEEIRCLIRDNISHMQKVVRSSEELNVVLPEFLSILNIDPLGDVCLDCFNSWTSGRLGDDRNEETMLRVAAKAVKNYEVLSAILEHSLECFFGDCDKGYEKPWFEARQLAKVTVANPLELEQALIVKESYLTLNLILLERANNGSDYQVLLNMFIGWLPKLRIRNTTVSKIPLIWLGILKLALKYCEVDENAAGVLLYKFSQTVLQTAEDVRNFNGWKGGLLSMLGLYKEDPLALSFKFLSKAVGGYVLAQLPEMKGKPQVVRKEANAPCRMGQPGCNKECAKILLNLNSEYTQGDLKKYAELAINEIQNPKNSMHNVRDFLTLLSDQVLNRSYFFDLGRD